jgi:hypothetical protein
VRPKRIGLALSQVQCGTYLCGLVDYAEYVAVVDNGELLAPKPKKSDAEIPKQLVGLNIVSKVRKGHEGNTCQTVRVTIPELKLTCSSIVSHVQAQFTEGI